MIEQGSHVRIDCALVTDDGTVLYGDPAGSPRPLDFMVGSGRVLPVIDGIVRGMGLGESCDVELGAKEAFGERDPDLVFDVPAAAIPHAEQLPVGEYVVLEMRGTPQRCKVESVGDGRVVLDCNHEYAGRGARLHVSVLDVRPPAVDAVAAELHGDGCACGCHELKRQLTEGMEQR